MDIIFERSEVETQDCEIQLLISTMVTLTKGYTYEPKPQTLE